MAYVVAGNRKGKILIHNGYRYQRNKQRGNKIYWRCWRFPNCSVYLHTHLFNVDANNPAIQLFAQPAQHDHGPEDDVIDYAEFRDRLNRIIVADPTKPLRRVYDEAAQAARRARPRVIIPEFHRVSTSMGRTRSGVLPRIPRRVGDVDVAGPWAQTWRNTRFLSKQDRDWEFLLFATNSNYTLLSR